MLTQFAEVVELSRPLIINRSDDDEVEDGDVDEGEDDLDEGDDEDDEDDSFDDKDNY